MAHSDPTELSTSGDKARLAKISLVCSLATLAASFVNLSVHEAVYHTRTASAAVQSIERGTSAIRPFAALCALMFAMAAFYGPGSKRLAWIAMVVAVVATLIMGSTILM